MAKQINCPAHPGKHSAMLYQHSEEYAGIWECPFDGSSDACEHENRHTEQIEVDTVDGQGEHTTYPSEVEVCDDCNCTIE